MFTKKVSHVGSVCILVGMLMLVTALLVSTWKFSEEMYESDMPTAGLTVVGNLGNATSTKRLLNTMHYRFPNAHILLGDLKSDAAESELEWCNFIYDYVGSSRPITVLAGNEEAAGEHGSIESMIDCMPVVPYSGVYGKNYYIDVPSAQPLARVFMISPGLTYPDATFDYAPGTMWHDWLATKIDEARAEGVAWIIVGMHHNCHAVTVGKTCESGADIMKLLIEKKVDMVLQAGERLYGRTSQLTCFNENFTPDCSVGGWDNIYTAGNGPVVVFAGTGGRSVHAPDTRRGAVNYFKKLQGYDMYPEFGFLDLQFAPHKIHGSFISEDNDTMDVFTIKK